MVTHFFGHGGLTEWADERILTHEDIQAHGSTWKPTVLFTWACLSQWHVGIFGTALNEALLLQPARGHRGIQPPRRSRAPAPLGTPCATVGGWRASTSSPPRHTRTTLSS